MRLFVVFLLAVCGCQSQNIETSKHLLLKPSPASSSRRHFGASLAVRAITGNNRLFVGAPSAGVQVSDIYPGQVYSCPLSASLGTAICTQTVNTGKSGAMGMSLSNSGAKIVVCGSRYTYTCASANIVQRMTGVCYRYDVNSESTEELITPCPQLCPSIIKLDLFFLLDESGSVRLNNYEIAKDWIIEVASGLKDDINDGSVHVGMITFNSNAYLHFGLAKRTFTQISTSIKSISYLEGGTRTDKAINRAVEEFKSGRNDVPKMMIVVTDGDSNEPDLTASTAKTARRSGITMVAVGVGNGIKATELKNIAGANKRVLTVSAFDKLDTILATLTAVITETASGGLEGASGNLTNELYQCQSGMSVHHDKNGNLNTGAVGSYDRTGSVIEHSAGSTQYNGVLNSVELGTIMSPENITILRESYLGYSVASGKFLAGNTELIASGMPRYHSRGQVVFYPPNSEIVESSSNHYTLHPFGKLWQLGAYFGHSLLAIDLNKDSYDDLLVSAPLYSDITGFDQGRVLVYMNDPSNPGPQSWVSTIPLVLSGSNSVGSRFGYSLGAVGDVDQNGYTDVIVGAPLEEATPTSSGAVYVYYLSASGISDSRKQRILGSSLEVPLVQFGGAVAGDNGAGIFVNSDNYPDVVVSAPSSDAVMVLRSRPVIEVTSSVTLQPSKVNVMRCAATYNESCSTVVACISARLRNGPTSHYFDFNVSMDLDSLIGQSHLKRFVLFGTSAISTERNPKEVVGNVQKCFQYNVNFNRKALDDHNTQASWFNVVPRAKFSFDLTDQHKNTDFSGVLDPVVDHYQTADWLFETGCVNGRCQHDLTATASYSISSSPEPLIFTKPGGSFIVSVTIANQGPDNSYFTTINVTSGTLKRARVTGTCVELVEGASTSAHSVLRFLAPSQSLKNLFPSGGKCQFAIEYDLRSLTSVATSPNISVSGVIYSNGGDSVAFDPVTSNNFFAFTRQVRYSASLIIGGSSSPAQVIFDRKLTPSFATHLNDLVLGGTATNVKHTHEIHGVGPLVVKTSQMKFTWPKSLGGRPLFYLYDFTCEPSTNCICTTENKVNHLDISTNNETNKKRIDLWFPEAAEIVLKDQLTCTDATCAHITCRLNDMTSLAKVTLTAAFKIWVPTLSPETVDTQFFSEVEVNTGDLPLHPPTKLYNNKVTTTVLSEKPVPYSPATAGQNIGAIIGGILGGVALLALIVLGLWKAGYFKSKYGEMTREARQTVRARNQRAVEPSTYEAVQ